MKIAKNLHEARTCAELLKDVPVVLTAEVLEQVSGGEIVEVASTPQAGEPVPPAPPPPMFPNW